MAMDSGVRLTELEIENPIATPEAYAEGAERVHPAKRLGKLDGKTVALYWNGKQRGPDALKSTKERFSKKFKDMKFIDVIGDKGGTNRYLSDDQLEWLSKNVDAVVCTSGDCGSCTSWLIRDMCELERRGVPNIGYVADIFDEDSHFSAVTFGVPQCGIVIVPDCFSNKTPEEIDKMVEDALPKVVDLLTNDIKIVDALPEFDNMHLESAPKLNYRGDDLMEAFDNMQLDFISKGWSDGLPLVPPTKAKVDAMIAASGLDGDHVVGKFAPGFGIGTVRKIAANAVMAGMEPKSMPVLMATMECILEPSIGLRTWAMSTGPQFPIIMVSGPHAKEIGLNSGCCAVGPGSISQVNVSIGRALRLIMMNVGLSYPGITDMDTIGTPAKFSFCIAENEERNPWNPWRVDQGFSKEETTVSVTVPYGMTEFFDFKNSDPEILIECLATLVSQNCGSASQGTWLIKDPAPLSAGYPFHGTYSNMMLMCPDHAELFAKAGWSIKDYQQALHRKARLSFRKLMLNKEYSGFAKAHPDLQWLLDAPDTEVGVSPNPETYEVFVVGASAGRSQFCFGGTNTVTKKVKLS